MCNVAYFIPVNPVYFELIIHRMPYGITYPQHAIRTTRYAICTKNAVSRRLFRKLLDFDINFSKIVNKIDVEYRIQETMSFAIYDL